MRSVTYSCVLFVLVVSYIGFSGCSGNNEKVADSVSADSVLIHGPAPDSILAALNSKITADPHNPSLLHERAKIYLSKRNFPSALSDMGAALDIDSTRTAFFLTLADLYLAIGKSGNSKAALEKCLSLDSKNIEANLKLAELYLFVKNHNRSIEYIDQALKTDPHNARAYFMKGMNFQETGDTAKAISSFRTAIDQAPEYYEPYMQLGILFTLKKNKLAVQYFNSVLALRPQSVEAMYGRAMFYQESQDYNKAIEGYTNILRIEPCNKNAHFNLGFIHQEYLKVLQQAVKHYTDAINCDPNYFAAYYNRGLCYESLGNIAAAKIDYQKTMDLNPSYTLAKTGLQRIGN